jgi:methyl-accepting chemotaxis protein
VAAYEQESIPSAGAVQNALTGYLDWLQPRLAAKRERADTLSARLPVPVMLLSILAIAMSTFLGVVVARTTTKPLTAAVATLNEVACGDVSHDVPPQYLHRRDEIGMLAKGMQTMIVNLRAMIGDIAGGAEAVSSSSTKLTSSSTQMTAGSQGASGKAHSVASAAEEMSSNVATVAAGMEQTTTNLAHVASATEQMTATIGEIAGNSEKARRITGDATRQAARITEQIQQLGHAAHEIGKVTETITEICSRGVGG